ncbi:hypothetical protein GWI33_011742, partial [Rhynchophorus ferrugineus]
NSTAACKEEIVPVYVHWDDGIEPAERFALRKFATKTAETSRPNLNFGRTHTLPFAPHISAAASTGSN